MANQRRHIPAEEKIAILRQHLLEGTPVSELCKQHNIHVTLFYEWQRRLFENGARAFEPKAAHAVPAAAPQKADARVQQLEAKLARKHEALSELLEEHIQLKKALGES